MLLRAGSLQQKSIFPPNGIFASDEQEIYSERQKCLSAEVTHIFLRMRIPGKFYPQNPSFFKSVSCWGVNRSPPPFIE